MRKIKLTQGKYAIVDDRDYPDLAKYRWYAWSSNGRAWYARRNPPRPATGAIYMHRAIVSPAEGQEVDHVNGDGLDNRRRNLRTCTHRQNSLNRRKTTKPKTSKFRGVRLEHRTNRWHAKIHIDGRGISLGYFDREVDAAHAYDQAARTHFGEFARPNFPAMRAA